MATDGGAASNGTQHFQLVIEHETDTARITKVPLVVPTSLIKAVNLTLGANAAIIHLFKGLDTNGDGVLTAEDFDFIAKQDPDMSSFGTESWAKLQEHFDVDQDGTITLDEFRLTIKGFAIAVVLEPQIGFSAPHAWTMNQWSAQIEAVFNKSVERECAILGGWYQKFDGKRSALRSKSNKVERGEGLTIMGIYLDDDSEGQLLKLFGAMDKDASGTLEADDFAVMSKNPNTASFWDELKSNFDADGDEVVTVEEFTTRVVATVCDRIPVGSTPRKDWTWRQVIARLTEWSNWMVQEQCKEIFEYFAHGEYGQAASKETGADGYGCGKHLGAPAFPGGEPFTAFQAIDSGLAGLFVSDSGPAYQDGPAAFGAFNDPYGPAVTGATATPPGQDDFAQPPPGPPPPLGPPPPGPPFGAGAPFGQPVVHTHHYHGPVNYYWHQPQ